MTASFNPQDFKPEEVKPRDSVPPAPPLSRYKLIMAPIAKMTVDRRYQRDLKKGQVKKLVDGWDWDKYHPIILADRPDGLYAVIAGQQRMHAAMELGIPALPAILMPEISIVEESKSFIGSGQVAIINPGDRFRARIIANEEKAFDIWNIVNKAGFSLSCLKQEEGGAPVANFFSIAAMAIVENIYDTGNDHLARVLKIIFDSWATHPSKDISSGTMIMGVYFAMRHIQFHGGTDQKLIDRLVSQDPDDIMRKGVARFKSMVSGKSVNIGLAAVLVERYNNRRRAGDTVPPYTHRSGVAWAAGEAGRKGNETQNLRRAEARRLADMYDQIANEEDEEDNGLDGSDQ